MLNSLAQVLVKSCAPGVPDFYQGTEGWAFDLVDPDNRRPVDFGALSAARAAAHRVLAAGQADGAAAEWLSAWQDGRIKVLLTAAALGERAAAPALFARSADHPLDTAGDHATRLFGFARSAGGDWRVVVVPRLAAALGNAAPAGAVWATTALRMPPDAPGRWRNVLTGETVAARDGVLFAADAFRTLPLALLRPE